MPDITSVRNYLTGLQESITSALLSADPALKPAVDEWERPEGGTGRSCAFSDGKIFEKAGVNFSHVRGPSLPPSATAHRPDLAGLPYEAMGVSLVFHPLNPHVPTTHANVRFFSTTSAFQNNTWWFGGGFDLTPYYGYEEDAIFWHRQAREAVEPFGEGLYPRLKSWCDRYFYLKHRHEARGVGGLFYDDFNELGFDQSFALTRSVGDAFLKAYLPIVERRRHTHYTDRERQFQLYRRGRYVEFNLVYDRGTLFGLQSGGRTESILMSLPPLVRWDYNWTPEKGSREAELTEKFLPARDWLAGV